MFGQQIRSLREDHDLTQAQLAEIIEVNPKTILRYEYEQQDITSEKLKKICMYFGVSADYILGLPKGLQWPR